jgi:hypothetical protein
LGERVRAGVLVSLAAGHERQRHEAGDRDDELHDVPEERDGGGVRGRRS